MDWKINHTGSIKGRFTPPADKSITHRAIMFSAIAEGVSTIENYLVSADCVSTLNAFKNMGISAEVGRECVKIKGRGLRGLKAPAEIIDAGNSGTTVRLLSGILSGQEFFSKIIGDESLSRRPMKRIIEPLSKMGAVIKAKDSNYLPLEIEGSGGLQPIYYKSPVASAQVKSCVLLAGLYASGKTSVLEPLKSRDHTERMLKAYGADIAVDGLEVSVKAANKLCAQNIG